MLEYLNVLRENICEAYTGILQGVKDTKPDIFLPYVQQVLEFITMVSPTPPGPQILGTAIPNSHELKKNRKLSPMVSIVERNMIASP